MPPVPARPLLFLFPLAMAMATTAGAAADAAGGGCDCDGCPDSDRVYLGLHVDLTSPSCPEGSVAAVTRLRSADGRGKYHAVTWNPGAYSDESNVGGSRPYVYRRASSAYASDGDGDAEGGDGEEVACYAVDPSDLPVVGDRSEIKVTLNCESLTYCDLSWDVGFGCVPTGVNGTLLPDPAAGAVDGGAGPPILGAAGGLQVLSDVDDTVTCSNPSGTCDSLAGCAAEGPSAAKAFLAGADRRLEHHEMYPGVAELMLGLALGPSDGRWNDDQYFYPSKPMMLSARPREAESVLAIDQDSELNVYLESTGARYRGGYDYGHGYVWGCNVDASLYGTLFDFTSFKEFGQTKARHYDDLASDRPGTNFAFLGDTGQGDPCAARSMLDSAVGGDRMAAVLLHDVLDDPAEIHGKCESPDGTDFDLDLPEGYGDGRVHYFRTHADAALWSLDRALISCQSAYNVLRAVDEWADCRCRGNCPDVGRLPTGVAVRATRDETRAYCDEVAADRTSLAEALESCDEGGDGFFDPDEYVPPSPASAAGLFARGSRLLGGFAILLLGWLLDWLFQ